MTVHSHSQPVRQWDCQLDSRLEVLGTLVAPVEERWGDQPALRMLIDLCLEELISNTIKYGLQGQAGHTIGISVREYPSELVIRIQDDAAFFDPFHMAPTPDLGAPLDERPIGGLGVHLVRSMVDEASVVREGDYNVTQLVKRLS